MVDINALIQKHRTIRKYQNNIDITDEVLNKIILSTRAMPSWGNGQCYSIVIVKDTDKKEQIARVSSNPQIAKAPVFIVFVADYYKTNLAATKNEVSQEIHKNLNGLLITTLDAGIGLGAMIIAAEAEGLGVSVVGGIRSNSIDKICEILNLPEYTFPLVGICLGYPDNMPLQKPRMPINGFAFYETYQDPDTISECINEYDEIMSKYLKDVNRLDKEKNWSYYTSGMFSYPDNGLLNDTLKKQKFKW